MNRLVVIILFFWTAFHSSAQRDFFTAADSLHQQRVIGSSIAIGGLWSGTLIGLHHVWYSDSWGDDFHTFDDSKEWLQMDKCGHFFTGQLLAQRTSEIYQWSGISRNNSRLIGSLISFGYLSSFELMDGRAEEWGFSWSDIGANALGSGWYLWQDLTWKEQRIKLKFSAHLSPYAKYRPTVLGSTFAERLLKDYNGQTYWLSINPSMFLSDESSFPKWLSIAFGYSVEEKVNGMENDYSIQHNSEIVEFSARRQYLVSLDIDLSRLPIKRQWLKTICNIFNHIKIPFPAIEFTKHRVKGYGVYF